MTCPLLSWASVGGGATYSLSYALNMDVLYGQYHADGMTNSTQSIILHKTKCDLWNVDMELSRLECNYFWLRISNSWFILDRESRLSNAQLVPHKIHRAIPMAVICISVLRGWVESFAYHAEWDSSCILYVGVTMSISQMVYFASLNQCGEHKLYYTAYMPLRMQHLCSKISNHLQEYFPINGHIW